MTSSKGPSVPWCWPTAAPGRPLPGRRLLRGGDLPFVVGVNGFHGEFPHTVTDVQEALSVNQRVPVIQCDARQRTSAKTTLLTLVEHAQHSVLLYFVFGRLSVTARITVSGEIPSAMPSKLSRIRWRSAGAATASMSSKATLKRPSSSA